LDKLVHYEVLGLQGKWIHVLPDLESPPFYFFEWKTLGVTLSHATMANWILAASRDWLIPIVNLLHQTMLKEQYLHADETTDQVLQAGKSVHSTKLTVLPMPSTWIYACCNNIGHERENMDIEKDILKTVAKILLVGTLLLCVTVTTLYMGSKKYFWYQVDQKVAYHINYLEHTAFGDLVDRPEVGFVVVWRWSARIDIMVVHLKENDKTVFVNVIGADEDTANHSYHAHVTTTDGINTAWSAWIKNSAGNEYK